jgi:hypothetical protein
MHGLEKWQCTRPRYCGAPCMYSSSSSSCCASSSSVGAGGRDEELVGQLTGALVSLLFSVLCSWCCLFRGDRMHGLGKRRCIRCTASCMHSSSSSSGSKDGVSCSWCG